MKRRTTLLLAFFGLLIFTGTVSAQQAVRVACVGDSITAGSGSSDREAKAYPVILGQLLGDRYEVRNFGIGGRTLLKNGDRPYWNEAFLQESLDYQPDIVVIKLGTNDSKPQNWDTYGVEFEGNLREMLTQYKNLPSRPKVYACFPSWIVNDRQIRESVIVTDIIPIISKVAAEVGVSVIDLHTTLYGMPHLIPDGVHPNDLGYLMIAHDVYQRIK